MFQRKPSEEEISFLLLQIHLMLTSGLTLTQSLESLSRQLGKNRLSEAILSIKKRIEEGQTLSDAFKKAEIFPEFFIEMLKTAYRGENLETIMKISSDFLRKTSELKNKIFSSLTYPAFVILLSFISVVAVVKFIMPKIAKVLAGLGKGLPMLTKIMLGIAKLLEYVFYLIPLFILFILLRKRLFKKEALSHFTLKIPLIGRVIYYFNLSRFSQVLGMSIKSGIPIVRAVALSIGSISNSYLRKKMEKIPAEVAKGTSLSKAFSETLVFPEDYISLLYTGQKSGEVEKVLILLSDIYTRQALRLINFWLRLIEPLSILIIGIIVAFLVLSVILPITEFSTGIKK